MLSCRLGVAAGAPRGERIAVGTEACACGEACRGGRSAEGQVTWVRRVTGEARACVAREMAHLLHAHRCLWDLLVGSRKDSRVAEHSIGWPASIKPAGRVTVDEDARVETADIDSMVERPLVVGGSVLRTVHGHGHHVRRRPPSDRSPSRQPSFGSFTRFLRIVHSLGPFLTKTVFRSLSTRGGVSQSILPHAHRSPHVPRPDSHPTATCDTVILCVYTVPLVRTAVHAASIDRAST